MLPDPASKKDVRQIVAVTAGYILTAGILALVGGNREFVFYIVVMVILSLSVYAVHRRVGLTRGILWCISLWGFFHMAGGIVRIPDSWPAIPGPRVLYNLWLVPGLFKYDQFTHVYGFAVTTWLCWQALCAGLVRKHGIRPEPTLGLMVLCAAGGMGFGALNEIVEFIATLTLESTNVGGYENTGWDLVANLVGSAGAAVLIALRRRSA